MRIIRKYELLGGDDAEKLFLPAGARPLFVAYLNDYLHLWCEVEETNTPLPRHVYVRGDETQLPACARRASHVGSTLLTRGGETRAIHVYLEDV